MTDEIVPDKVEEITPQMTGKKFNVTGLVSMITGILTYIWLPITSLLDVSGWLAIVLAPISALVAVITGGTAKRNIRQSDGKLTGKKMANTGLWLGWIYIIGNILLVLVVIILVLAVGKEIISTISGWLA